MSHLDPGVGVAGLAAADRLRLACSYLMELGGGLLGPRQECVVGQN